MSCARSRRSTCAAPPWRSRCTRIRRPSSPSWRAASGATTGRLTERLTERLTDQDLTYVGDALYDLLRRFDGYRAAMVGWDPEQSVDLDLLHEDWLELALAHTTGLVLADDLCERWGLTAVWEPFTDGYRWRPYQGHRNPYGTG